MPGDHPGGEEGDTRRPNGDDSGGSLVTDDARITAESQRPPNPGTFIASPPPPWSMEWRLFATLAQTAGTDRVRIEEDAGTVEEALEALVNRHPELDEEVFENGDLRDHLRLLVDGTDPFREADGLATELEGEAELALFPPVSGG